MRSSEMKGIFPTVDEFVAVIAFIAKREPNKDASSSRSAPGLLPEALLPSMLKAYTSLILNGRGERIRTSDPLVPNQIQGRVEIS